MGKGEDLGGALVGDHASASVRSIHRLRTR